MAFHRRSAAKRCLKSIGEQPLGCVDCLAFLAARSEVTVDGYSLALCAYREPKIRHAMPCHVHTQLLDLKTVTAFAQEEWPNVNCPTECGLQTMHLGSFM